MKKQFLYCIFPLLLAGLRVSGQKNINLIVLSSGGEKFYLILNGVKYNTTPEASVKANGLKSGTYDASIVFESDFPELKDKVYTIWEGKETDNKEFTYVVEKKGVAYRMRFLNVTELSSPVQKNDSLLQDTAKTEMQKCKGPMPEKDFVTASQSIGVRSVEDSRLRIAKEILEKNCFSVKQLTEISAMFEYDNTRIEFLKEAYSRCTDKENYKTLIETLDYKNSRKELEEWMMTLGR